MILCSGCSKSGTHFLTSLMLSMGKEQLGGTLIKRPSDKLKALTVRTVEEIFSFDNMHFIHGHLIHTPVLAKRLAAGHRHLFIQRHPRNIAISWMRHRIKQDSTLVASSTLLEEIIRGGMFGHSVPNFIDLHLPWKGDADTLTVRFEDLVARDMPTLEAIADYVDGTPDPVHYQNAFGAGSTFMGSFSVASEDPMWTDDVERAWVESGGPEVERTAGYI